MILLTSDTPINSKKREKERIVKIGIREFKGFSVEVGRLLELKRFDWRSGAAYEVGAEL